MHPLSSLPASLPARRKSPASASPTRVCVWFGNDAMSFERATLRQASGYYDAMFRTPMQEQHNNVVHEHLEVAPGAWKTALGALQGASIVNLTGPIALQALEVLDYLQPKETAEGKLLGARSDAVLRLLPSVCIGVEEKLQAFGAAVAYGAQGAAEALRDKLSSARPEALRVALLALDFATFDPVLLVAYLNLPGLAQQAHALLAQWRDANPQAPLSSDVTAALLPAQTPRGEALLNVQQTPRLYAQKPELSCLAARGNTVLCGAFNIDVRSPDGTQHGQLKGFTHGTYGLALTDAFIVACGQPSNHDKHPIAVRIWDARTRALLHSKVGSTAYGLAVQGEHLAVGHCDAQVCVYNLHSGAEEASFRHVCSVRRVALSQAFVVGCTFGGVLKIWNRAAGVCELTLKSVGSTAFTLQDNVLRCVRQGHIETYVAHQGAWICAQRIKVPDCVEHVFCQGSVFGGMVHAPPRTGGGRRIVMWDLKTGNAVRSLDLPLKRYIKSVDCTELGLFISDQLPETVLYQAPL